MKISFSILAKEDLIDIWLYGEDIWSASAADSYLDSIDSFIYSLSSAPEKYPLRNDFQPPVRLAPFKKQLIVYTENKKAIEIIRVLHESMDIPQYL